jgi:sialidase-1
VIGRFIVSRDDTIYEAFPDVAICPSGRLVCVFAECTHHGDRGYTRIVLCHSDDRGRTWSAKRGLSEPTHGDGAWNCARITSLRDGRLAAICDYRPGPVPASQPRKWQSENHLWLSADDGVTWDGPHLTPMRGIVPDRLLELPSGRWIISSHAADEPGAYLYQRLWYSDDQGASWSGPVVVARAEGLHLCEASILALDERTLVAFHRENSGLGWDCQKTVSRNSGETWGDVVSFPLPACHRPVAGRLLSGKVLITHRFMQGGKGWIGWWTQNLFAALTDEASCLAEERAGAHARIMPVDFDRSPESDTGYSGWTQFPDGEIYVVNYIMDDAPKAHIRGYAMTERDFTLES